ncbi:MAG: hypothetical protein D6823_04055 [Chloroflexi bacterium]|nr:MAG: hypothetical protein D6823_04055 [Chloroflexota bacterium]
MRNLYHLSNVICRNDQRTIDDRRQRPAPPPFRPIRRMARWVGLLLIRLGARLRRYAHARHAGRPSYVR